MTKKKRSQSTDLGTLCVYESTWIVGLIIHSIKLIAKTQISPRFLILFSLLLL